MTVKERDAMLVKIDDFLQNGFTAKVIKTINDYFDKLIAKVVKWVFGFIITTAGCVIIGLIVKSIWFSG